MDNIIDIRDLRKVYKMGEEKIVALNSINLQIKKGEICCLLGTSGSGKSTLLNMMAGLEKPTKGEIIINGYHIERMNEEQITKFRQKHIGFVFQSYNLMNALTALENVALPLEFGGVKKEIRNRRAFEMLKAVGLGDRIKHKPTEMSGGQQQRVSIARAFIGNPEIVFADEPTGNLDTKTTLEIMNLMVSMAMKSSQTLVIVTHDVEISSYADKIIYIRDGKIEKEKSKYSGNEGDVNEKNR